MNETESIVSRMVAKRQQIDLINKLSFPFFALSIAVEYVGSRDKAKRQLGDLADAEIVHHGANCQYLDQNYGDILIMWNRPFGASQEEVRRIRHEFGSIVRDVRSTRTVADRLRCLIGRPGWRPAEPVVFVEVMTAT
jgi:cytochrome P450